MHLFYKINLKEIMDAIKQEDLRECNIKYTFDNETKVRIKINLDELQMNVGGEIIPLIKQPCYYGNYRYYMKCNRCDKKCTIVYGREFEGVSCNVCSGRIKTTLNRTKTDCTYYWERAKRIAMKIDSEFVRENYRGYTNMIFPPRPKYMKMDKYIKLFNKFYDYVNKGDSLWGM